MRAHRRSTGPAAPTVRRRWIASPPRAGRRGSDPTRSSSSSSGSDAGGRRPRRRCGASTAPPSATWPTAWGPRSCSSWPTAATRAARPRPAPRGRPRLVPARPDGRLRRLRRPVRRRPGRRAPAARLPGRARRHLPAPDAAAGPRDGDNDGGYAVSTTTRSTRGWAPWPTSSRWPPTCTQRGMSLCVDLVLNHTAAEHPWARPRPAGDPAYRAFYRIFPDRTMPDRTSARCPRCSPTPRPAASPTSRASGGCGRRSTTSSGTWTGPTPRSSPRCSTRCSLANRGVDVLRLDAAPFLWKREGTDCQNQPEVHLLLQALRALVTVAAPVSLQGRGDRRARSSWCSTSARTTAPRPECDLAYHNQLMVLLWSSLATRDVRLAPHALGRMRPAPPTTAGSPTCAATTTSAGPSPTRTRRPSGSTPHAHRAFLTDFYAGEFPGSFARGAVFQANPRTGDRAHLGQRGLAGRPRGGARRWRRGADRRLAVARLLLLYSVVFSYGGVPLALHGRRARAAQRPGWRPTRRTRRQPLAAPAADGLGGGRAAARRARSRHGVRRPRALAEARRPVPSAAARRRPDHGRRALRR